MPQASRVWMLHARTGLNGIKGTLAIDGTRLVFRPESPMAGESVFEMSDLRRVRRVRGSPILEIYPGSQALPPVVGFYFVKPPSLTEPYDSLNFIDRRKARKRAMNTLRGANALKKGEVERWVGAIRSAGGG
jgi:hypothetical protein